MKLIKPTLFLLFAGFALTTARGDGPVVQKDVAYLGDGRAEKADVYTPPGPHAAPLPAVLLIHGGGWVGGDKADKRGISISTDLAAGGYVVFAINYKLSTWDSTAHALRPAWPQNLYDCKSALRYMRKQAAQLGIDPTRIAVMGESAGGHLALLLGSTAQASDLNQGGLDTDQGNEVSCIIDLYGVPDLSAPERKKQLGTFAGSTDAETAENVRRASPITYLDAKTPPVLILQGSVDNMVPVETSRHLADELKQLGIPYQYVEVPGAGHGFDLQPKQVDLRPVVLDFLGKYLGNPPGK